VVGEYICEKFRKGTTEALLKTFHYMRLIFATWSVFVRWKEKETLLCKAILVVECSILSRREMAGAGLDSSLLTSMRRMGPL